MGNPSAGGTERVTESYASHGDGLLGAYVFLSTVTKSPGPAYPIGKYSACVAERRDIRMAMRI